MKKFNWINVKLIGMFGLVIFLFSFTSKRNSERKLKKIVVEFVDENSPFITEESVNKLLIENNSSVKNIQKDKVDLKGLEQNLNNHNMIQKCEVFVTVDGVLKAVVKQKTPVARVFGSDGSFYVDYEGHKMPLSDNFTARVPIVSGTINKQNNQDLIKVFRYIYDDEFLQKNIIGVEVLPGGSLKMRNRNFNYVIDFGKTINVDKKFKNYKAFFQKAVQDSLINNYKTVNLKFTQQVVCTKN
ncbi:cell division protein FtsQ/DivIB [Flavobacterium macacae]|uniref:Cell division protein FtsQ n=1 Tax=Flavobacterium macacae TaxID=2488993 RepID=A0A3P3WG98_9FLAO|nr:cell division protein FtsQ [Flavobacterium macacae]RRJ93704.1 cell division protein FtsQ [Flavobacterium macacae]